MPLKMSGQGVRSVRSSVLRSSIYCAVYRVFAQITSKAAAATLTCGPAHRSSNWCNTPGSTSTNQLIIGQAERADTDDWCHQFSRPLPFSQTRTTSPCTAITRRTRQFTTWQTAMEMRKRTPAMFVLRDRRTFSWSSRRVCKTRSARRSLSRGTQRCL